MKKTAKAAALIAAMVLTAAFGAPTPIAKAL